MPDTSLLRGVSEFEEGGSSETRDRSASAAHMLSQLLMSSGKGPVRPSASSVATGEGLPALEKKLRERILAGEFVDFTELPTAKGKVRGLPHSVEGQIVVVQAADLSENRKLVPDIATWVQCFGIYMAVVTSEAPDRTKSMLAYMALIAKCSLRYRWPSWAVYDLNFRQEAADTGLRDWSRVDPSIYSICFTGASISLENWCKRCNSIDHVTETCPHNYKAPFISRKRESVFAQGGSPPKKRPAPHSIMETCRRYNSQNGECRFGEACMYQHKCETCGDYSHPSPRCSKAKKASAGAR